MNLEQFHQMVADEIKRGTTLTAEIQRAARQAALWIERNHQFLYMEQYDTFTISEDNTEIDFSPGGDVLESTERLRALKFIRHTDATVLADLAVDEDAHLRQVDALDFQGTVEARPKEFYLSGRTTLKLVQTADQDYTMESGCTVYSNWPTGSFSSFSPTLLDLYEDIMLAQTIVQLAPTTRMTDKQVQKWAVIRDQALHTAMDEDEELRQSMRSEIMSYGGMNH